MPTRPFMILPLLALWVAACVPAGDQPVFSHTAIPEATSLPLPTQPRLVSSRSERILSFDVSPDGKTIALGTSGGVRLYDLRNYKFLRSLNDGEMASSLVGRRKEISSLLAEA